MRFSLRECPEGLPAALSEANAREVQDLRICPPEKGIGPQLDRRVVELLHSSRDAGRLFEDYPHGLQFGRSSPATFTWDSSDTHNAEFTAESLADREREAAWTDLGLMPDDF